LDSEAEQKRQLQAVFFPEGISFDSQTFGTAPTCLAFTDLEKNSEPKAAVASPTGFGTAGAGRSGAPRFPKTVGGRRPSKARDSSPTIPSWNQITAFLQDIAKLRDNWGTAA
jgi:hypothetical protein